MLVGVVSDTHDHLDRARATADLFDDRGVGTVVHCGDVVAPFTLAPFDRDWAFHHVAGNNEGEPALRDAVGEIGTHHGDVARLSLGGHEAAVYHGTERTLVDALVDCGDYDYVFRGHTHERAVTRRGETTVVNPGGIPIPGGDDAFHVALVDVDADEVTVERP